LNSQP